MGFFNRVSNKNKKDYGIDYNRMPVHIAIIMDGNGRWAKNRGLPRSVGHSEGSKTLEKITEFCDSIGIKYLTVYGFSTENWSRPKSEVDYLMGLILDYMKNAEKHMGGKNIQIRALGNIGALSQELQSEIARVTEMTKKNTGIVLNIAWNYGGRDEIVNAVKQIAADVKEGRYSPDDINPELVANKLYTGGIPDPDILIRPGGEYRISNFLLWQSAYTEFWYTDVLWPDFRNEHILEAISEFQKRNRRFGGV